MLLPSCQHPLSSSAGQSGCASPHRPAWSLHVQCRHVGLLLPQEALAPNESSDKENKSVKSEDENACFEKEDCFQASFCHILCVLGYS